MSYQKATTGFRIGASVGIIILMLGVAIALSISATSTIGDQMKAVINFNTPLEKAVTQMVSIQKNKEEAANNAVMFLQSGNREGLRSAEYSFYLYDAGLSDIMTQSKDVANMASNTIPQQYLSPSPDAVLSELSAIGKLDNDYNQAANAVFSGQGVAGKAGLNLVNDLKSKEEVVGERQNHLLSSLESSSHSIETSVDDTKQKFLTLEIIITAAAGIISLASCYFVNQINKDLVREVVKKTESLQKANEKLKDMNMLKDQFINEASHELKSPLNPIYGFAELAKCGDIDKEEALAGIVKQARQIEEVANKMLDLGRLDDNRLRLSCEKFDLNALIMEIAEAARTSLNDGLLIETDFLGPIEVEADRIRIAQVIRNILNNSIKFTRNGRVTVTSSKNDSMATVKVADSGIGIHPEVLPKIFNKFVTKSHKKENLEGSGLGLYLCKGIIEAHGGSINASNNENGGATVSFSIPLVQRDDAEITDSLPN